MPDSTETKGHEGVVPAAGLGNAFPARHQGTPKEMLPVVDKPAISTWWGGAGEAFYAGLDDVLHGSRAAEAVIEGSLRPQTTSSRKPSSPRATRRGWPYRDSREWLPCRRATGEPKGLGKAVSCAAKHRGPRTVRHSSGPTSSIPPPAAAGCRGPGAARRLGCGADGGRVGPGVSLRHGRDRDDRRGTTWSGSPDCEKPAPEDAPTTDSSSSRSGCAPGNIRGDGAHPPGRGGEIQPPTRSRRWTGWTRAGRRRVYGVLFRGRRYDTGQQGRIPCAPLVQGSADRAPEGREFVARLRKSTSTNLRDRGPIAAGRGRTRTARWCRSSSTWPIGWRPSAGRAGFWVALAGAQGTVLAEAVTDGTPRCRSSTTRPWTAKRKRHVEPGRGQRA